MSIQEVVVDIREIAVGDYIKFKAVTRWSSRAVWRKVTGVGKRVQVRYGGWPLFIVRDHEIIEHDPSGTDVACKNKKEKT